MGVLVDVQRVSVTERDQELFRDLSFTVNDGDRVGVVGINGTGKSTLLRLIAGTRTPDGGAVIRNRSARINFLEQEPHLGHATVRNFVGDGWEVAAVIERFGIAHLLDRDVASLSGGQAKRVALAHALAAPCELLILDEPTNHLDLRGVAWLESWLSTYKGGLIMVSHDRHLLDRVTTRMLELDRGSGYLHDGGYASFLEARLAREEIAQQQESTRRNLARSELAWLRRGAKARTRKPQARIDAAKKLINATPLAAARTGDLDLTTAIPRLGDTVFQLDGVALSFAEHSLLSPIDWLIGPGDRIGILGDNGTGKTSLLNMLARRLAPTAGRLKVGHTVVLGYYDQHSATLDPRQRVMDVVAGPEGLPGSPEDIALMNRFWFTGSMQQAYVDDLSGGERRRLQLLAVLAQRPNVLILDEPTNDLDLDTLRALENFLDTWPGTLIVVSHDRAFLERTVESLWGLVEGGHLVAVPGGVEGWLALQQSRAGGRPVVTTTPSLASGASTAQRMRELDKVMTRCQRQRDRLNQAILEAADRGEAENLGRELLVVTEELEAAEEEWLALATRNE